MLLLALMAPWAAMGQTPLTGENFNSMTSLATSYSATDWYAYNAGSGNNWTLNTSSGVSSSKCVQYKWNSSYAANCYLVSTPFDVNAQMEELSVSLYEKTASSSYPETFEVFFVKASDVTDDASITSATKYMVIASASYTNTSYAERTGSNDNSALAGQSVRLVIHCTSAKDQHTLYIDDITVTETIASSCSKPDTFEHSNVTHNSATLTWSGGSDTYNVEVKGGEWADWTEILHETTLTTKNLENLTMDTDYQARVQSVCTGENSGWKTTSFSTECGPVGIGYQCGFEGPNTGGTTSYPLPACWTRTGTSTSYPYAYNSGSYLGSYCLYFSGTSSTDASAMLPAIEGGVNGKRLSFYLKVSNTAVSMSVGYLNGTNTFVEVESVAPTTIYSYQLMEVDFTNIEGNPTNIVLKFKYTSSYTAYAYIDDLELQETPPCADMQVQASTITATATAYNAATVTWTGAGAATQWKVQCSTDNTFASVDKEVVANATTANITGLTAETTYYVRIAPYCTENNEYTPWSTTPNKSFSTPESCPAPVLAAATNPTAHGATLNWTGTSDHYDVMYRTAAYTDGLVEEFGSSSTPTGWTNGSGSLNTETGTATITSGSNWSFGTNCGVFDSHAYFNMYSAHNYWLITPQIAIGTDYPFSFKVAYTKYSSGSTNAAPTADGPHKLYVLISIDEKAHWTVLREYNNSGSAYVLDDISKAGQTVNDISLAAYAGKKAYIAFYGVSSTTDYDNNIHIDNVTVGPGTNHEAGTWANAVTNITASTVVLDDDNKFDPETIYDVKLVGYCPWTNEQTESNTVQFTTASSCETPANVVASEITSNSAKISWDGHGLTTFNLRYSKDGGANWNTVNTVSNPHTLDGVLEANTEYQVQVQTTCGNETWSASGSFTTECGPISVASEAYSYGFEDVLPWNCWTVATGSSVTRKSTSGNSHDGDYYMCFNGSNENVIAMPSFEQATNTLRLEYWVRPENYTNSSCGSLAIGYYNATNEFVALKTYAYNSTTNKYDDWESNTYIKQRIDFDAPGVPDDATIVFRQFNTTSNYWWYVDDVKVKVIPVCADVDNVHYESYTNHSATIAWTADAGQSAWQIAYKAGANFDPNDATELATATIVDATANPYLFDMTLEAATTYYMYVRANCTASSNGYGDWSDTYAFFTTLGLTPAPSAFTASNPASQKVDLVWTAGGGDFEDSWDLYYVASTTAPEAPTPGTTATKTVTTLPTALAPYELTGLTAETRYYIWVRANHGSDKSAWVALTGDFFETLASCPTPTGLTASNRTQNTVDLSWTGSSDVLEGDGFVVEYRVLTPSSETETNTETFAGFTPTTYSAAGELPTGWKGYSSGSYKPHVSSNTALGTSYDITGIGGGEGGTDNFLYMIGNNISPYNSFTILPQFGNLVSVSFDYAFESASYGTLYVGYCTDNSSGSTFTAFDDLTITKTATSANVSLTTADIAAINDNNGYLAFKWNCNSSYGLAIDNVAITTNTYTPGAWQTAATGYKTGYSYQVTGLTAGTKYDVRVYSGCTTDADNENATTSFFTLADGNKVFVTEGNWNTAANWVPAGAPAITDDAIIRANVTIPSGTVAMAKKITFEGTTTPTLTIADGGQLQTDNTVTATVKKNIKGYGAGNEQDRADYYLIANPLSSSLTYSSISASGMLTGEYDLYQFLYTQDLEWRNYETTSFSLSNGTGYLYANENDVELTFTGTVKANNVAEEKTPSYYSTNPDEYEFNGWNLYGNPFVCNAYLVDAETGGQALPYYKMNDEGTNLTAQITTGAAIAPMEGIFYEASSTTSVYFTRTNPAVTSTGPKGNLNILVSNSNTRGTSVIDNAIISFGNPNTLGKLNLFASEARIFIPQDGKDYAVAYAESNVGEMPLNFKAEKNGAYTLSFTAEEVGFSYLHLIDNLTGNDVDLLANPSYTFNAKMTDYTTRFRLVFATGSSVEGDNFGFINGSGNLCIFGIEGTATLQVIDVTGRILSSETFSGSYEKQLNAAPGVYVMRLINGNEVKTQKIVLQ